MYDHNIKAGNQGDVIKHTALIAAASALMKQCCNTFHYSDTFAGYAYNPLMPNGEWRNGIEKFYNTDKKPQNSAIIFWRELWEYSGNLRGSVYPGSSLFMLKLCLQNGLKFNARLWDISPSVISQLVTFYGYNEVELFPRPAKQEDFIGQKPNLLLIDPPGLWTKTKHEYPKLEELLGFFDKVDNCILWFPMTAQGTGSPAPETKPSREAYDLCLRQEGIDVISVRWSNGIRTCGCHIAHKLQIDANKALMEVVTEVATTMNWVITANGNEKQ